MAVKTSKKFSIWNMLSYYFIFRSSDREQYQRYIQIIRNASSPLYI